MSGNKLEVIPVPTKASDYTTLRHYLCPCQFEVEERRARCGAKGGKPTRGPVAASELCIVCHQLKQEQTPCQFCGVWR